MYALNNVFNNTHCDKLKCRDCERSITGNEIFTIHILECSSNYYENCQRVDDNIHVKFKKLSYWELIAATAARKTKKYFVCIEKRHTITVFDIDCMEIFHYWIRITTSMGIIAETWADNRPMLLEHYHYS